MREHFQLNLDKEFFMGNDRTIKVIASIFAKKVKKGADDYRGSINVT